METVYIDKHVALVNECRQGSRKAQFEIYKLYATAMYNVALRIVNDDAEAEDVLQDVFVKIWKNIDMYSESKGRFYTWMLNIARNTSIDKLRSKNFNNTQKNLSSDNFVNLLDESNKLINWIDTIGIQEFVKKLKPKCIEIFKVHTHEEASEELAMPLGTIKTQNRNCINDLRNYLKI